MYESFFDVDEILEVLQHFNNIANTSHYIDFEKIVETNTEEDSIEEFINELKITHSEYINKLSIRDKIGLRGKDSTFTQGLYKGFLLGAYLNILEEYCNGLINYLTIINAPLEDIEGNVYTTVVINNQEWIIENFRSTKYSTGDVISNTGTEGSYAVYGDDNDNISTYGLLYDYYTILNNKNLVYLRKNGIRDLGWRVPTEDDWVALADYMGGYAVAGGKLKEVGTTHWNAPNTGATDEIGFTALPGGMKSDDDDNYYYLNTWALFWTNTAFNETYIIYASMRHDNSILNVPGVQSEKAKMMSIRFVKDLI